ncbi:MAG: response regulator, partial [Burkholderiaceae bacterium]
GSKFTIFLPQLNEQASASAAKQISDTVSTPAQALKVLVVDDNADAAHMLAMYVQALGHHVLVEHGSKKALERAGAEAPDVCLVDIGLPDMDGNELARRLQIQSKTREMVLVAVTGYGQEQDRSNALSAGFDHHFVKPVDAIKLANLLNDIYPSPLTNVSG